MPRGTTILDAAKSVGIHIPTLCYMKLEDLHYENNPGACRICVVEIEGRRNLAPSCKMECTEGMVVRTHTPRVMNARRTVMELIPERYRKFGVTPVGRLDKETEGLLLLTNDGDLAHRILSPRSGVWKTYYCEHDGEATAADVEAFAKGLLLPDGLSCLPAVLLPLGFGRSAVRLQEGKFHQVRRMMAFLGLPLCYLKRVCEGGLWLGDLAPGAVTELDMGRTEQLITSSCDFDEKKLLANCVRNSQRFGGNDEKL